VFYARPPFKIVTQSTDVQFVTNMLVDPVADCSAIVNRKNGMFPQVRRNLKFENLKSFQTVEVK